MKLNLRVLLLLSIFTLAAASCTGSTINENVASGEVIFQDDFSAKTAAWTDATDQDGATQYLDGAYQIQVNTSSYYLWSNPEKVGSLTDVRIEVDATKTGGPDTNDIGVICRYVDESNFYFLTISSDGYYGVGKLKNAEDSLVGMEGLQFNNEAIRTGNNTNHIRVDCVGSTLALYANDTLLVEVTDSDFTSGGVGLIAGSYEIGGVDVRFDNFSVIKP